MTNKELEKSGRLFTVVTVVSACALFLLLSLLQVLQRIHFFGKPFRLLAVVETFVVQEDRKQER